MELCCVDPARVRQLWPHARFLICRAMRRGGIAAFAPVEQSVLSGRALLWLATDRGTIHATAVTELAASEWRKVCVIVACGGRDRARWLHLIEGIEEFARAEGCAAVRILGRKGWARVLPEYRMHRIVLEKDVR